MGDEKTIIETITEDIAEAAKAIVSEVKSIAAEVTEAVESTGVLCDEPAATPSQGDATTPKDDEASR
jgi:hypothetical protein